ncbi:MAG: hypothetical protein IJR59_00210 [Firmicutes bacterium]|nr:hypothetical protein [Bacillota bacterium]
MNKLDKIIRKSGIVLFFSLLLFFLVTLISDHILSGFGLGYCFTGKDLSLGPIGESRTYAKASFNTARMINAGSETENAVFAVLCPDGRSSFLLETTEENAKKINSRLEKGKTVKIRGEVRSLDTATKESYLPFFKQYGYEEGLIRENIFTQLTFGQFWALHPILNSLLCVIVLLIIFFMIRSLMYGSYGHINKNIRKYGYDLDDISNDFETAEKFGSLCVGKKYFVITKSPINAVATDDVVLAYIHHTVEKLTYRFIPLIKQKLYFLVLTDKKGKEYEIQYLTEKRAYEALMAVSRFGHITTSTTDEYRNSARTSIKRFVELSDEKKRNAEKVLKAEHNAQKEFEENINAKE